jgi:hypothetical protein
MQEITQKILHMTLKDDNRRAVGSCEENSE